MAETTPVCDFGRPAVDFALPGIDGRTWSLADAAGARGTLVMFICNHCPYVKAIAPRLAQDVAELAGCGIGAIAVMPNDAASWPEDSVDNMKLFAARHGFAFPYVVDESQDVARAYGAVCTPDFFGYNAGLELQYRGRLDACGPGAETPPPRRELVEAMRQVAETGRGPEQQVPSMGCSIKWKQAA